MCKCVCVIVLLLLAIVFNHIYIYIYIVTLTSRYHKAFSVDFSQVSVTGAGLDILLRGNIGWVVITRS